jgi:hypothetical protein
MTAPETPKDPFIRQKFTDERTAAKNVAQECFERYPENQYQIEVATPSNRRHASPPA